MWCLGCPCPAAHSITPEVSPSFCFSGSACSQQNTTGAGAASPGRPVSAHKKPQTLFPQLKTATSVSLLIWINLGMYIFFTGKNKMWLKRGLKHFFFLTVRSTLTAGWYELGSTFLNWNHEDYSCLKISPCWNSLVGLRPKPCNCHFSHQCQRLN